MIYYMYYSTRKFRIIGIIVYSLFNSILFSLFQTNDTNYRDTTHCDKGVSRIFISGDEGINIENMSLV